MDCPGSVRLSELLPPADSSEHAEEGILAHALAERCLREGVDTYEISDDPEMIRHVQVYVDFVREAAGDLEPLIEHRIECPDLGSDFGGTADCVIVGDGWVRIIDLKYGAGLPVQVEGNAQLRYYAFGVLRSLGITDGEVIVTIVQPRAEHTAGPIREEVLDVAEVLRWGEHELVPAMQAVDAEDLVYRAGEHCRFCPARLICPVLTTEFNDMATETALPEEMGDNYLAAQYEKIAAVKMYIRALEAEALKRAMQGSPLPGTKLIVGRSSREWKPGAPEALVEAYGDDALTEPVVKSPAQVEKMPGGKKFASEWAYKKEGAPTLVPYDKPGTPYNPMDAGAKFAAIDLDAIEV